MEKRGTRPGHRLATGVAALLSMACSSVGTATAGGATVDSVTGTVTYLQRVALPPDAVIKVQLVDVSRADAPAVVLGEQVMEAGGRQVPFAFEIRYAPTSIEAGHSYAVQARIEDGGRLRFINDQRYPVITRGAPTHVDLVLKLVGGPASN